MMMSGASKPFSYNVWPLLYFVMGYAIVAIMFYMVRANAARVLRI